MALPKPVPDTADRILSSKQRGKQRLFDDSLGSASEFLSQHADSSNVDANGTLDMSISRRIQTND